MDNDERIFCKKCNAPCDIIKDKYLKPIIETRKWDGSDYELVKSNIESVEYITMCGECGEAVDEAR